MGNFYTNFTLRGPNQEAVAAALSGRTAVVAPVQNGSVVAFDEESDTQNSQVIAALGAKLSGALRCPVLAVLNHDDNIFFYQLFEQGAMTDQYCSAPGYFTGEEAPPSGGNARKLCAAFGVAETAAVKAILHPGEDEEMPVFALEQHEALVQALGISDYAVGGGYGYISRGEVPGELEESDLIHTQ